MLLCKVRGTAPVPFEDSKEAGGCRDENLPAGLDLVEHGEQGYSDGAIGGSPILGALENSSELLARTVMASGHSAVK